jgi:hypothetical protein
MALAIQTGFPNQAAGVNNFYTAKIVSDAVAAVDTYINCGFTPRYIQLVNITDLSTQEYVDGMGTGVLNSVAAGTMTLVAAGVVVDNGGVTLKAAIIPASKTFYLTIFG